MEDVPAQIEHTVLGPETTWDDVTAALDAALRHGMRACVPPQHVAAAAEYAPTVDLTTVVGFPHGQHETDSKVTEARTAWDAGAGEIDLVPDHGRLLAEKTEEYVADIAEVVAAVPIPVKVIVETGLLDEAQREAAAEGAVEADAAFLKTSTGFVAGGATAEDVTALARHLPVKASGGIDSWEAAEAMFDAGAERIGASAGGTIVEEWEATTDA